MLKLKRRIGEQLFIGNSHPNEGNYDAAIVVEILDIAGSQVSIGIKSPDEFGIWREEILDDDDFEDYRHVGETII